MRSLTFLVIVISMLVFIGNCSNDTVAPKPTVVLQQVSGCHYNQALAPPNPEDSCFSWQYSSYLSVAFCVVGNCCPDHDRFSLAYSIDNDSISIAVADTAAELCQCTCPFLIRAEFHDLPLNQYAVVCFFLDSPIYRQVVTKSHL